ncbi:MAG: hydrocarbon degradation protein [Hyphomicrobiaceae bacterium]|nr:hydrocarbon degradation protein [Hyphomicrobiaceae bacterium]
MRRTLDARNVRTFGAAMLSSALMCSGLMCSGAALATEGYFQNGYGARQKALAGAGVADGKDATAASLNPAGIVRAENELDVSASIFNPNREFTGSGGPGFTPDGRIESDKKFFLVPNVARNWKIQDNAMFDALTLTMYGNGGMNTSYGEARGGSGSPCAGMPAGIYCGGPAGVDLQQILLSAAVAKKFGNVSVGVAPILAVQIFEAKGLGAFAGASSDPSNLTNRGKDVAVGFGMRAGVEVALAPNVRFGLAGNTPIWSQSFDKYRGLFAEGGGFDIPASVQTGIAVDLNPAVTVMLDYKHIWYSGVASIANPSTDLLLGHQLGAANGPGFGWKDVDVIKMGIEWRTSQKLTLRAGYAYNTQPVQSADVMLNLLAPGVTQHHLTGGMSYKMTSKVDLELAGMYAPRTHVKGTELGNPAHQIDASMSQFEVTMGVKYRFGQ